jgi:predicted ArsR family transcriptional regulator
MTPNARTTDPQSSQDAVESIAESAGKLVSRIVSVLKKHGPMAPEQIAEIMGLEREQVWKRCSDGKRDGLIYVYDERGHTNRTGRRADILAVAE